MKRYAEKKKKKMNMQERQTLAQEQSVASLQMMSESVKSLAMSAWNADKYLANFENFIEDNEDSMDPQRTWSMCMREIKKCEQVST